MLALPNSNHSISYLPLYSVSNALSRKSLKFGSVRSLNNETSGERCGLRGGYAAYTLMAADSTVLTVEYKMNLLAPADGEKLMARARVLRSGKTLKICAADVYVEKNSDEIHCATMLATIMCLAGKSDRAR